MFIYLNKMKVFTCMYEPLFERNPFDISWWGKLILSFLARFKVWNTNKLFGVEIILAKVNRISIRKTKIWITWAFCWSKFVWIDRSTGRQIFQFVCIRNLYFVIHGNDLVLQIDQVFIGTKTILHPKIWNWFGSYGMIHTVWIRNS